MKNKLFGGIMPALVTPFDEEGKLRAEAARGIMDWQLKRGANGFYINGATGEGLFLPESTRNELAELAMATCKGRGVIIDHVGAVDPASAIRLARRAGQIGCDAVASLVPNYIASYSDDQILDYYKRLADASSLPVLVYCTGLLRSDPVDFIAKAIKIDGVIGTKFTMTNFYNMHRITELNGGDINVINGPDEMLICGLTMGADGGIGSTYNIMPEKYVELFKRFRAGDFEGARAKQFEVNKIIAVLLKHGCTASVKEVFNIMGFGVGNIAYPGKTFDEASRAQLIADLKQAGFVFPG